jgi:UDP-2,4-diacetamido-2,4,6-trideoxy-beta-L-altropyranose hydrolase
VTLGADPARLHLHNVEVALRDPELAGLSVDLLRGGAEVADAMASADLALAGAGVTATELCAFGVPAVLLVLADNQEPVAEALAAAGAAVTASPLDPTSMALALSALAGDADRRRAMAAAGRALVDGRGALRVVARLRADLVRLRAATADDARRLFDWVNDPVVRSTSFAPAPVAWETHVTWLERTIADPARRLFVVESDAAAIGQVRFDLDGDRAEISIGLAAAQRGSGLGAAAIDAGVRALFRGTDVVTVVARIRTDNRSSAVAFGDAGFAPAGEGSDGGIPLLRYARSR